MGMMHQRHPIVARTIIEAIESNNPSHAAQGVVASMESLRAVGFTIPSWEELILAENQNRVLVEDEDPSQPRGSRRQQLQCTTLSWKESCALFWERLKRFCSVLKAALWLLSFSPVCPQCARPPSTLVVSASLSPSLHVGAGVAVHSTSLATTNQRA